MEVKLVGKDNGQHIAVDRKGNRVVLTEAQYQWIRGQVKQYGLDWHTIPVVTPEPGGDTDPVPQPPAAKPKRGK